MSDVVLSVEKIVKTVFNEVGFLHFTQPDKITTPVDWKVVYTCNGIPRQPLKSYTKRYMQQHYISIKVTFQNHVHVTDKQSGQRRHQKIALALEGLSWLEPGPYTERPQVPLSLSPINRNISSGEDLLKSK